MSVSPVFTYEIRLFRNTFNVEPAKNVPGLPSKTVNGFARIGVSAWMPGKICLDTSRMI